MTVTHTSKTGKTYYLHAGTTKTGKAKYFFSMKQGAEGVDAIPDGFEIYENVNGQVFLRKIPQQIIRPEELAYVEAALKRHGEPWQYRAEVKKNTITVYECGTDIGGLEAMAMTFGRRRMADTEKLRFAHYMAVLRFTLIDKETRAFAAERFCFRGSVNDWIPIAGPNSLAAHVRAFVKHLGRDSLYELF